MKKAYKHLAIVIVLSFFFGLAANAQTDTTKAAEIKGKLIDNICTCISQKNPDSIKTTEDLEGVVMNCFTGDGLTLFMDYAKASGTDMNSSDQMRMLGEDLGKELAASCPAMKTIIMRIVQNQNPDSNSKH